MVDIALETGLVSVAQRVHEAGGDFTDDAEGKLITAMCPLSTPLVMWLLNTVPVMQDYVNSRETKINRYV